MRCVGGARITKYHGISFLMAAARPYVLLNHIDAIISFFGLNLRLMMWIIALAVSSVRWKGTKIIISKKKEAKDKIVDIWI